MGKILSLIKSYTTSKVKINIESFSNEAIRRVVQLFVFFEGKDMEYLGRFCLWALLTIEFFYNKGSK